jgi:hypothetical protein
MINNGRQKLGLPSEGSKFIYPFRKALYSEHLLVTLKRLYL